METMNTDFNLLFSGDSEYRNRRKTVLDEPAPSLPTIPLTPDAMLVNNKFTVKFIPENNTVWSIDHLGNYIKDIDFKKGEILFSFYNTKSFQFYRAANKFGCLGIMVVDITTYEGYSPVETTRYRVRISEPPWRSTLSADDESFSLTYVKGTVMAVGEQDEVEWHDRTAVPSGVERFDSAW